MLNRAFFSLQSNWIPTVVALANLFLNALLDLVFYRFGTWGIPLSTALVNIAGTAALLVLLRRRIGGIEGGEDSAAVARIVVASAAVAGVAYGVWKPLDSAARPLSLLAASARSAARALAASATWRQALPRCRVFEGAGRRSETLQAVRAPRQTQ